MLVAAEILTVEHPTGDVDDLIYGDAGTVPSER